MKPLRITEVEARWLEELLHTWTLKELWGGPALKCAKSILAKVRKVQEPSQNAAVAPIEQALIAGSRGKVVVLVTGHAQASVRAGKLGVTPETAHLVGEYLARTKYLTGPLTLLDILNKWPSYISKAQATQPPPSVPSGFGREPGDNGAEAGQGTPGTGEGAPGRLRPGF